MKYDISDVKNLSKVMAEQAHSFAKKQVILLCGEMGSGKTTAVAELVRFLGGANANSPTYAIHQSYKTKWGPVDHIDLYRVKNEADLDSTGFWDLFLEEKGLILIEWGDKIEAGWIPTDWTKTRWNFTVNGSERLLSVIG
jgi:tRNA threonylcarbamoyladenosine biosynthesis protein TsaE